MQVGSKKEVKEPGGQPIEAAKEAPPRQEPSGKDPETDEPRAGGASGPRATPGTQLLAQLGLTAKQLAANPILSAAIGDLKALSPERARAAAARVGHAVEGVQLAHPKMVEVPPEVVTRQTLGAAVRAKDEAWAANAKIGMAWVDARKEKLETPAPVELADFIRHAKALDTYKWSAILEVERAAKQGDREKAFELARSLVKDVLQINGKAGHLENVRDNVLPKLLQHLRFGARLARASILRAVP
jgi:hypothetical protein